MCGPGCSPGALIAARRTPCHCGGVQELRLLLLRLRRLLRSRGSNVDDADDLIQEAFLRLQIYCREHDVEKSEAFLVRTVLNLATDRRRRRVHENSITESLKTLKLTETGPSALDVLTVQERLLHMKAGLDRLSPRRKEVFVLNRIEGYSFPQIAERLGITLSSVEKHAAKAIMLMADWMDDAQRQGP